MTESLMFTSTVAGFARDVKGCLVAFDTLARFAEVGPGEAEVAERSALAAAVAEPPAGRERRLQPRDSLPRRLAQIQDVGAGVGVAVGVTGGIVTPRRTDRRPGLPGLDVGPLGVEQGQARERLAGQVKVVGAPEHRDVVGGVPRRRLLP